MRRRPLLSLPALALFFACSSAPDAPRPPDGSDASRPTAGGPAAAGVQPADQGATRYKPEPAASRRADRFDEKSVKPGINKNFLASDLDIAVEQNKFERETREVFANRHRIASEIGLQPGMAIADVGAGTGIFLSAFAQRVGDAGKVYAVDISPRFIQHLAQLAEQKKLKQVEVVHCTLRSAKLAPASVDMVFTCDTYHHFEYPKSTLSSLHSAIKPGGMLIVVDFERIPGVTREWVLGHVRCGKKQVIEEIEAAGFRFLDEVAVKGLRENYMIRFRRPR